MKINISEVGTNSVFSEVKTSAGNEVVGGKSATVNVDTIGITNVRGDYYSTWANGLTAGQVTATPTSATLIAEGNWNGGVIF